MSASPFITHAFARGLLRHLLRLLVPLSAALTIYLYLYPFFLTCAFPLPAASPDPSRHHGGHLAAWFETIKLHLSSQPTTVTTATTDSTAARHGAPPTSTSALRVAPFRLLALGDPQLEGDTSIPNAYSDSSFPHLHGFFEHLGARSDKYPTLRKSAKEAFHQLVDFYFDDIPNTLESIRKRIDLFGNDFYLAHMYRTMNWWALPTHTTVLGDLLGSQWISDEEFEKRGRRYWNRAFKGTERVPDDVAAWPGPEYEVAGSLGIALYNETWQRRIINVAGNHDIGYAGDLTKHRMERFERVFGRANYELRFEVPPEALPPAAASSLRSSDPAAGGEASGADPQHDDRLVPELRIVVLNDMNLDTPVETPELQDQTYKFVNDVINTASAVEYKGHFTVVLTHVPLYKPEGVCVDAPYFSFHDEDGTLKEQNQLSADASKGFVEGIFGLSGNPDAPGHGQGRRGVILNGHDHEGCDTYHFINQSHGESPDERAWQATRWPAAAEEGITATPSMPGVREITVRSMMGGYGGNAGLLSAWFDEDSWEWRFEYAECALGTQHIWWAVHILDLIAVVLVCVYGVLSAAAAVGKSGEGGKGGKAGEELKVNGGSGHGVKA